MTTLHRLRAEGGLELAFASLGATWLSCRVPMPQGGLREVLVGNDAAGLPQRLAAYMGATIGRYANRIARGRISREGETWQLTRNAGSRHQLHGGPEGFHARQWKVTPLEGERALRFELHSPDGDQGFPGAAEVAVTYRLADAMTLEMDATVQVSRPSPVCITNHAYFNLDGAATDVRDHPLRIRAAQYLPVDEELIPLGPLAPVEGTGFDFRDGKTLRQDWLRDPQQRASGGYDHAFALDEACRGLSEPAATLWSADRALRMDLFTSQPALQLYGGQALGRIAAGGGKRFVPCQGVALEPQVLPDSPNRPGWHNGCWIVPGQAYRQVTRYVLMPRQGGD